MVKVATSAKSALASCLLAAAASAESINFINQCSHPIELYHSQSGAAASLKAVIAVGGSYCTDVTGPANMFRHTASTSATLLEVSVTDVVWIDMSIIPPSPGYCGSYEDCKAGGTKTGFNVAMSVAPKTNGGAGTCSSLFCAADDKHACADAYLFPSDDTKTHSCPSGTAFDVTFCYTNDGSNNANQYQQEQNAVQQETDTAQQETDTAQQSTSALVSPITPTVSGSTSVKEEHGSSHESSQTSQQSPTYQGTVQAYPTLGLVKSKYTYKGKYAGNFPGTYDAVTDLKHCKKTPVTVDSPVGPYSEPVSMVFRGPMLLYNIAVFLAEENNSTWNWNRVSLYSREEGKTENLVFMNNKNVDYSTQPEHGPQGYASRDGKSCVSEPVVFAGLLEDGTNTAGGGLTGTEVNIMTEKKCDGEGLSYCGKNDHQGWGGGKKVFVTEVIMPLGSYANLPAMWLLNAQILHSNQYCCNCRGRGPVGGCGELDVAEVIETCLAKNMVSTHNYIYNGTIVSPGGDNFASRPFDQPTVYVTLIDDSNDGLIKVMEFESFDFTLTELGPLYQQLVDC